MKVRDYLCIIIFTALSLLFIKTSKSCRQRDKERKWEIKNLLAMYLDTINNAMSVLHLKLPCITLVSLVPLFENHRPKEGKGILMKVFSLTYFPERKGKEWKERET